MAEGDIILIEMSIRLPESDYKRWGKTEIKGIDKNADRDPAFRIEHLLAPAGVKIDVTHKAGRNYDISWYLTRNL